MARRNNHQQSLMLPASGAVIDPTAVFREITADTSFERDEAMQGHLKVFADSFLNVARTPEGQKMMYSLESVGRGIKDQNGFLDSVKVMFRLAKRLGSNPTVQFGMFLGFFGFVTALVAHLGPVGLVGGVLQFLVRRVHLIIFTTALAPLSRGFSSALGYFFSDDSSPFLEELDKSPKKK